MKEIIVAVILYTLIATVIMTLPTMWLWNWLMPVLFKLPTITFWQAWGINLLSTILFNRIPSSNNKTQ